MSARQQSSTSYPIMFFMTLAVDHTTGATGKTVTVTLSKNGASFGAAAGAVTEIANGWYSLAGNATDRNTLGPLVLHATATGCDPYDPPAWDIITVDPFAAQLGITALPTAAANTTGGLSSDVLLGGTASAGTTNSITLAGGVATDNFYKYALVRIISGTGAGQTPRLILDYVGSSKVATVNKPWTTAPDNTSVFTVIPWSTPAVVSSGIAQAGGASTITLQSIANSTTDDIYAGLTITIFSGTGLVQSRIIQSYVASTRVATVDRAWAVNPDSTSVYEIAALGPAYADVFRWNGASVTTPDTAGSPKVTITAGTGAGQLDFTSGVVKANFVQVLGTAITGTAALIAAAITKFFNVATPTGTVNSLPDAVPGANTGLPVLDSNLRVSANVTAMASGVIAAATFAANALDAVWSTTARTLSSYGTLVADIWAGVTQAFFAKFFTQNSGSTYAASVAGSVVREIASNAATSVATIAGAVWNALRASYVVSGSFGEGIATILTQTGLIGTTGLTMNAPQFNSMNYPLVAGRTYAQIYGNALQFVLANTSIDLTDPNISFSLNLKPNSTPTAFVGTALTSQTGYFEVDAATTADWVTTANTDGLKVYGDIVIYSGVDPDPVVPIDVTVGWIKVVPGVNNS